MNFLIKLLLSSLSVIVASYILPGAYVDGFFDALVVSLFLALFSATLKPLLVILTIPVTVFSLGFFLLVINALMIMLADYIVDGFHIDGFWWALLFGVILAIVNSIFEGVSKKDD
ncbi:phage holin family protein [Marivirga arenosa]|uniref:Phage holin family protein n=1 Tax=Marivirga arenosa TaxID=3059076 RepID=A0AA49GHP6_9BACT|nr:MULTISPECIES: phage holin family protein [unclassified Marivirga]WKK80165.1 phage holin family protein [Marivirga sp. BKB1-2]WKK84795.1 phage holin family protein [Marivirga sp. ABR2-2]